MNELLIFKVSSRKLKIFVYPNKLLDLVLFKSSKQVYEEPTSSLKESEKNAAICLCGFDEQSIACNACCLCSYTHKLFRKSFEIERRDNQENIKTNSSKDLVEVHVIQICAFEGTR